MVADVGAMATVARALSSARNLILVHGGGSFGHSV
ncbi:MAG: hypothetical protein ACP5UK_02885, partial [Conexivisphaera sp.]